MARKKAEEVTAESVDDMTDEQVEEFMQSMQDETPESEVEQQPEPENKAEAQPEPEKTDDKPEGDEKQEEVAAEADAQNAEQAEDSDDEPQKADKIDFKRYDYERNRRKAAEEASKQAERRLDELLKAFQSQQQPQEQKQEEQQPNQPPLANEDPMAAISWLQEQMLAMQSSTAEERQQREQAQQQESAQQELLRTAAVEFEAAEKADPTVRQAYDHFRNSLLEEARAWNIPPHELEPYLINTQVQHLAYARQNNIPIDRYLKGMATARGWNPQQPTAQPEQSEAEKIAATADAQRKAKSLSNGGGSPGVSDSPTAEQILALSDKEFDALVEKFGSISNALAQ